MIIQDNKVFIEHEISGRIEYGLYERDGKQYRGKNITYRRCQTCNKIIADVWGCFERHSKTHKKTQ